MNATTTAARIAEAAGWRVIEGQHNPLVEAIASEALRRGERIPEPRLLVALRDGELTPEEIRLCRVIGITPRAYVKLRRAAGRDWIERRFFDIGGHNDEI